MIEELRLKGLGVIEDVCLELGPGFTAITGETGAGKTMVLSGLALLLGGRAHSGAIRAGAQRAEVEGVVRPPAGHPAIARAEEAGAILDDGALIVTRVVAADGRSRAHAGGRSVPVAVLAELADDLVTVHGQADQRGLLRPAVQREVLDRYAGSEATRALAAYHETFTALAQIRSELDDVTTRSRERAQEADLLRHGLAEIDAVAPQRGEEEQLRVLVERLAHVDVLQRAAETAHAHLAGTDDPESVDALSRLGAARAGVDEARGRDPELDALADRVAEISYLLSDTAADLAAYAANIDADPVRLSHAQQRLSELRSLTRKYAADVDGVIDWADSARTRLEELGDDERIERLTAEHHRLLGELATHAAALSEIRRAAAARLEAAVAGELRALAMPHATLSVAVTSRPDDRGLVVNGERVAFGSSGIDDVELLLAAHSNATPRPLHRGASGGELSRVMLALEVVLAGVDPVPTFVFDEVDAGVGGRAAVEVGRRLAALAQSAQVLVVTHLPQVAAFADHHLVVHRDDGELITTTGVRLVDGEARLEELSRMLAGLADSELGREHARELLAVAADAKAQPGLADCAR